MSLLGGILSSGTGCRDWLNNPPICAVNTWRVVTQLRNWAPSQVQHAQGLRQFQRSLHPFLQHGTARSETAFCTEHEVCAVWAAFSKDVRACRLQTARFRKMAMLRWRPCHLEAVLDVFDQFIELLIGPDPRWTTRTQAAKKIHLRNAHSMCQLRERPSDAFCKVLITKRR